MIWRTFISELKILRYVYKRWSLSYIRLLHRSKHMSLSFCFLLFQNLCLLQWLHHQSNTNTDKHNWKTKFVSQKDKIEESKSSVALASRRNKNSRGTCILEAKCNWLNYTLLQTLTKSLIIFWIRTYVCWTWTHIN